MHKFWEKYQKIIVPVLLVMVVLMSAFLLTQHATEPFMRYNEDNNSLYGLAARNWVEYGAFNLKFGILNNYVSEITPETRFYTNHPSFFLIPTAMAYKFFGMSEFTTRLGPIIFSWLSVLVLFLLVREATRKDHVALLAATIFAVIPAVAFFGKMLDHEAFVMFFALLSTWLYYKFRRSKQKLHLYLLLVSLLLGNLMGWHAYLFTFVIWVAVILDSEFTGRKKLFFLIPVTVLIGLAWQFGQIYWLGGEDALIGLKESYATRTSMPGGAMHWFNSIWRRLKLNFSLPILLAALPGVWLAVARVIKTRRLDLVGILLLFPLLVLIIFRQWSTHPYGVVYFAPIIALATAVFVINCYQFLASKMDASFYRIGLGVLISAVIIGSAWSANQFFEKNMILTTESIDLLKETKENFAPEQVCVGRDSTGLGFASIFAFYLEAEKFKAPNCLEDKLPQAIIFYPQLGEVEKIEAQNFEYMGYELTKCAGQICHLLQTDNFNIIYTDENGQPIEPDVENEE